MIALGLVGLWAAFSCVYLGVEDGSSALSPLGWITGVFFVPGGLFLQAIQGTHSNADLPLMAAVSLCVYATVALVAISTAGRLRRVFHRGARGGG